MSSPGKLRINWRGKAVRAALACTRNPIMKHLQTMQHLESLPRDKLKTYQQEKLTSLLLAAWQHVPYYRELLGKHGIVDTSGKINLENFSSLPPLTKTILNERRETLCNTEISACRRYANSSGGSTGEPVEFFQDDAYRSWNIANKIYYKTFSGQEIGDRELRLWGASRDLAIYEHEPNTRIRDWFYNRIDLDTSVFSEAEFTDYRRIINHYRPTWIEAYTESAYEFSKYLNRHNVSIFSPRALVCCSETLYAPMKDEIRRAFGCPVLNRYGSREVGDMACSCVEDQGLHVSVWNHVVEILDDAMLPAAPGTLGRVYVTALNNVCMPFIRYDIGDIARAAPDSICPCGRTTPVIADIIGRETSLLQSKNGTFVDVAYVTGLLFNSDMIRQYQVVQLDHTDVLFRIIALNKTKTGDLHELQEQLSRYLRKHLGSDCGIRFDYVDKIEPTKSGKFQHIVRERNP